jgi:hypothetical protein
MKRGLLFKPGAELIACRRPFSFDLQSSLPHKSVRDVPPASQKPIPSVTSVPLAKRVVKKMHYRIECSMEKSS